MDKNQKGKHQDREQKRTVQTDGPLCDEQFENVLEQCCPFSQMGHFYLSIIFFLIKARCCGAGLSSQGSWGGSRRMKSSKWILGKQDSCGIQ